MWRQRYVRLLGSTFCSEICRRPIDKKEHSLKGTHVSPKDAACGRTRVGFEAYSTMKIFGAKTLDLEYMRNTILNHILMIVRIYDMICLMFFFTHSSGFVFFVTSICTIHWFRTCFAFIEPLPYNATHLHATSRRLQLQENKSCMSVQSPAMLTELDAKIYPGIHYCNLFAIHGTPSHAH